MINYGLIKLPKVDDEVNDPTNLTLMLLAPLSAVTLLCARG